MVIIAKSCIGTTSNFQKRLLFNCLFIHHLTNMSLSRFDFHENNIWNQEKVILATKRFVLWVELRYVRWKLLFVARKIFMIYSSAYRRYNQKSLHQFQGYHNMIDKITCITSLKKKSYNLAWIGVKYRYSIFIGRQNNLFEKLLPTKCNTM